MLKELSMRRDYLSGQAIDSIYFGGGTPSLISSDEIAAFIDNVSHYYSISTTAEITLEANPDDLNAVKVSDLRKTAINRFSIGIQSFFEEDLKWMNRAHTSSEADCAIKRVQDAGFENITADLIYGYPLLTDEKWESNIKRITDYKIPHISAYSMTVEPQTALGNFIKKGIQKPMDENQSADQLLQLMKLLEEHGYEQYEISNFAHSQSYSKHNSNYWRGVPYLGIGPSAHSFNSETRHWNMNNNAKYIAKINKGELPAEEEVLSEKNKINEYIMTALRTKWGMDLAFLNSTFGEEYLESIHHTAQKFIDSEHLRKEDNRYMLTTKGKLLADYISSELFIG